MITHKPFYILRHGLSEANLAGIAAGGAIDSLLTEEGEKQALVAAEILHKENMEIGRIFHSPMQRAHRTATLANTHRSIEMELVPSLHEVMLGDWEGLLWEDIAPEFLKRTPPPNGENEQQHVARVRKAFDYLFAHELTAPPLIVAHGGTFHAIGHMYEHAMLHIDNCKLHYFEPWAENLSMPWKIFIYNMVDGEVVRSPATSCPTMLDIAEQASA
jgi:probable phosphoglycerate mutase